MVTLMTSTTTLLEEKMSKYELGTVALATYIDGSGSEIALRNVSGWTGTRGSISRSAEKAFTFRPLVVIDPEDREQVERLLDLYFSATVSGATSLDDMQAALREFANPTPPKPEEPTGLGAVVEDVEGQRWVRGSGAGPVTGPCVWWNEGVTGNRRYSELAAVKVLSEGVNL